MSDTNWQEIVERLREERADIETKSKYYTEYPRGVKLLYADYPLSVVDAEKVTAGLRDNLSLNILALAEAEKMVKAKLWITHITCETCGEDAEMCTCHLCNPDEHDRELDVVHAPGDQYVSCADSSPDYLVRVLDGPTMCWTKCKDMAPIIAEALNAYPGAKIRLAGESSSPKSEKEINSGSAVSTGPVVSPPAEPWECTCATPWDEDGVCAVCSGTRAAEPRKDGESCEHEWIEMSMGNGMYCTGCSKCGARAAEPRKDGPND